ncbi:hypothetical protein MACH26_21350 [Planctobacterium marinum]|uniref:Solute-binding protein family 3/N-terminal domain-containing protein n=1 Tax=Planctobacterium marinum TaxID=1631968 RepID=A0AA48HRE9_9ALTE|nr:hypothetical protein MACH26_21350 [Planctobacterium marinum]
MVKNSEDLSNYTVGIPRGDIYQDVLHDLGLTEGKEYITFSNKHEDTFMFAQQKLDLMIGSSLTLSFQLEQVGLTPDDVMPVLELNDDALGGNYLAINKNTSPETIKALQVAFDSMLADGSYGHIIEHYVQKPDLSKLPERALIRCLNGSTNITPASN